ncbi:hypothetical protein LCM10_09555 [Rossellomorea aquimaris]|uniref:hypothetical protein n=1 Tax=Rossellomorea aquimaris TaxID=189382 RepID=UPI001CD34F1E|nr:hypothetical protein [Rossellomorea aquimaris]MCA1055228.1 hypothetical protein [Rossellomorea aquimaris]
MKLTIKKFVTIAALYALIFTLFLPTIGSAEGKEDKLPQKEIPFPSVSANTYSLLAFGDGEIGNDHVHANIGSDGRFTAGLKDKFSSNWYPIIYGGYDGDWSFTGTSFTSLKVDGKEKVFGNQPEGEVVSPPQNIDDQTNQTVWKTGDVSVKQVLKSTINPATGIDDAIQVRYTMTNTGDSNHDVGLRLMIDTMVGGNDSAPFKVPVNDEVVSIDYEKEFTGDEVPEFWQAFESFDNPQISSHYTMGGERATKPDRFVIANWGSINSTKWDYQVRENQNTGDSAVGMWWNPVTLAPGETKTITTYYGRTGVGGSETLVLSGRQKLNASEWTSEPTNLIAYLNNNTGDILNNVRLEIVTSDGIVLVDNDADYEVGPLEIGETSQTTWRVQPNTHGVHPVTVNAYKEGSSEPFATEEYTIEALEAPVPPNISVGGSVGEDQDGIPMAGRTAPLTVEATYPDASSVSMIATDSDDNRYEAELNSHNGTDWTHTFIPSSEGLWGSPLTIQLIPTYQEGTTGEAQSFEIVLIDPSGIIYNAEKATLDSSTSESPDRRAPLDWELPGATVVLQYFDPELESWVTMTNEAYPGMLSPIQNPQMTGEDGKYAWDVAEGRYRVVVSRPGFETTISDEVSVPPPVLDLHVGMIPTDRVKPTLSFEGVTNGNTYSEAVSIQLTATDDEAGVRDFSYRLNEGEGVTVSDLDEAIDIEEPGDYSITVKILDYAGNETIETISFTIQEEQAESDIITILGQAIEKNNKTQQSIIEAMDNNTDNGEGSGVEEAINEAVNVNNEVKDLIELAKSMLGDQSLPPNLMSFFEIQLDMALSQNIETTDKLETVLFSLSEESSMSSVSSELDGALKAAKKSKASLQYVASYLIMLSRR